MITTKKDFEIVIALYMKLRYFKHEDGCEWIDKNVCQCNLLLMAEAKKMIERSAQHLRLDM